MKTKRTFWSRLLGGYSVGKLRIWPWKAEFWRMRTPTKEADIKLKEVGDMSNNKNRKL